MSFRRMDGKSLKARLLAKTMKASCDCWLFLGSHTQDGYGRLHEGLAHRVSYKAFKGEIPVGKSTIAAELHAVLTQHI